MSGDTIVTITHGRKSVGGINRMVMDAQYFGKKLEKEAKYQWEFSEYLNTDICQPEGDRKSTRLNSSHDRQSRMPSSA